jgi:hypothetical protein
LFALAACGKPVASAPVGFARPAPEAVSSAAPLPAPQILDLDHGRAAEFDLVVDGKALAIAADQPFQIELAGGHRATATLRRRPRLTYADHGVRFQYPSDLKLSVEEHDELTTIELSGGNSFLVTLRIDKGSSSTPKTAIAIMANAMRGAFHTTESGTLIKRRLGSVEVEGLELRCSVLEIEIQATQKDGAVVLMMFQRLATDTGLAASQFAAIAASLE